MLGKMNKKFDIIFLDADKKNYVNYLSIFLIFSIKMEF